MEKILPWRSWTCIVINVSYILLEHKLFATIIAIIIVDKYVQWLSDSIFKQNKWVIICFKI